MAQRNNPGGVQAAAPDSTGALWTVRRRLVVWQACVVIVLLAVVAAMRRGPWDPDELKYAQVVQGMQATGDLVVPQLWGKTYANKPPLYFWLVLASSHVLGQVGLPALLVPVVIAACTGLWLVSHIAARWHGARTGMLAAVVLVSMPLYLVTAQVGRMDAVMALFITAAVYCLYLAYVEGRPWATVVAFVFMGLGVLAKGPFGLLFPLAIAFTFLAITRKVRRLWHASTGIGVLALLALLAVWLAPAVARVGLGYLVQLIGRNTVQAAVSGLEHKHSASFYAMVLPVLLLPWVIFLPPAVHAAWKGWREGHSERELWLLCWTAVPLVILLLVEQKLPVYLLPAMPPIAILLARHWNEILAEPAQYDRLRRRVGRLFGVGVVTGLGFIAAGWLLHWPRVQPSVVWIGGALLVSLGVAGYAFNARGSICRVGPVFWTLSAVAPSGALFLALTVLPSFDAGRSWRSVAESLAAARSAGEPVVAYHVRPYLGYYVPHDMVYLPHAANTPDLVDFVRQSGSVWCVVRSNQVDELARHCWVEDSDAADQPSPKGPVRVVRLRPLDVAATEARNRR